MKQVKIMKNLMPFILILAAIGIFFTFIDSQYENVKMTKEEIRENDRLLGLALQLRDEREKLQVKYNSIGEEQRNKLKKVLPDTVDNVRLILDIDSIASSIDSGISVANISVQEDQNQNQDSRIVDRSGRDFGKIGMSFSVSADYNTFKEFLQALEDSLRLIDINSFSVQAGEGLFYNYNVSLDTYWLR